MKRNLSPHDQVLQAAREMRHRPTRAEEILWAGLRGRKLAGLKFHRQDVIGPFIADFYCASARLVVEVDGDIHDTQKEYDAYRTRQFEDHGYRVIRFSNDEVLHNLKKVLAQISAAALTPSLSPDSGGGEAPLSPGLGEGARDDGRKHTDRPQDLPSPFPTLTPSPSTDSGGGEAPLPPRLGEGAGDEGRNGNRQPENSLLAALTPSSSPDSVGGESPLPPSLGEGVGG